MARQMRLAAVLAAAVVCAAAAVEAPMRGSMKRVAVRGEERHPADFHEFEETFRSLGHYEFLEEAEAPTADPQKLAPRNLECYCKFAKQKVAVAPASAFNNLKKADDAASNGTSLLQEGEHKKAPAAPAAKAPAADDAAATDLIEERAQARSRARRPVRVVDDDEAADEEEDEVDAPRHVRHHRRHRRHRRHHRRHRVVEEDPEDEYDDEDDARVVRHRARRHHRRRRRRVYDDDDEEYDDE